MTEEESDMTTKVLVLLTVGQDSELRALEGTVFAAIGVPSRGWKTSWLPTLGTPDKFDLACTPELVPAWLMRMSIEGKSRPTTVEVAVLTLPWETLLNTG